MASKKLTRDQHKQLTSWLAMRLPYAEIAAKMQASFGFLIAPSSVTWHRQHDAREIAALQTRRERDRRAKQNHRAGIARQHCPTCRCATG